jgi:hypothetical protein
MATAHPIKPVLSGLALLGGIAAALAAGPAAAQNVPWAIQVIPATGPRTPAVGCQAVISTTARGAVQRCLAKVGVTPLLLTDFVATAAPVCKTTHVATSSRGTGYVYSNQLSRILRPACP